MTFSNEAVWDRGIRMVAGLALLFVAWSFASGAIGAALVAMGALALATGILGWCPAYSLLRFTTRDASDQSCLLCPPGDRL